MHRHARRARHPHSFVEELEPTHVATVKDGTVLIEQRALTDADWFVASVDERGTPVADVAADAPPAAQAAAPQPPAVVEDDATRKRRHNAPKLILKLEETMSRLEGEMAALDADMFAKGADAKACLDLAKQKTTLQAKYDKAFAEYEELDALTAA